eukprot:CAMPEP_0172364110 /NCGR_PEP_ID=MMETSP1060-20121228/7316_1 /TAXON_ID=37318 /ORGANISM="Pseudo-nitzschia pungens, Strain cf. cingulata" /LENGTH=359 /DNA_ID=CAMNT_0013087041 /DNA_START=16 /DNA_END=1095 /DNA_ORIENTATION=-
MPLLSKSIISAGKSVAALGNRSTALCSALSLRANGLCRSRATKQFGSLSTAAKRSKSTAASTDGSGFDTVGCVGLGLMGHGICQVAAMSGVHSKVVAFEQEQRFLDSGKDRILKSVDKLVEKEKITQDAADDAIGKIEFTTDMDALKDVDFVVEAVVENIDLKKDLYTALGDLCKPETIFASNTSSLSISEMAGFSGRPDRFLGVHFFNPVQLMKVVEVIETNETDPAVLEKGMKWVDEIGKVSVLCKDTPGFIVNRILVPSLMQSMALVDRKEASVKDIDVAMRLGCGHPMGPLHLADYIGLDTCHSIVKGWTENYPDEPAFFIPACLQEKIDGGDLGRKTGKGFYHWEGDRRGDPVE